MIHRIALRLVMVMLLFVAMRLAVDFLLGRKGEDDFTN